MYCTTFPAPASTGLGDDESSAYHHFRREARALATISSSFDSLANEVSAAYYAALSRRDQPAWTNLVARTAQLMRCARGLDGIVAFDAREREALDFFAAIVRENDDLLDAGGPAGPGAVLTSAA